MSLQNSDKAGVNAKAVLNDCIGVILEENLKLKMRDDKDASLEDWAKNLQNMIDKKKKEN